MLLLLTLMACVKNSDKVNVVRTKIPHDWVHQPPDNCGVGSAEIQSVNDDMAAAIDLAKEYAQIHLAERLAHLQRTEEVEGLVGASEERFELEHQLLAEHTIVEEAAHVYFEHGVSMMYVLVCLED